MLTRQFGEFLYRIVIIFTIIVIGIGIYKDSKKPMSPQTKVESKIDDNDDFFYYWMRWSMQTTAMN